MHTYESVLVATDGSEGSAAAVEHAFGVAHRNDATLHVLYVRDPDDEESSAVADRVLGRVEDRVASDSDLIDGDSPELVTAVRSGTPHEEIVAYTEEVGCDLVVMGTHGRTGVGRYLIGSVTERVVRLADVPVLATPLSPDSAVKTAERAADVAHRALAEAGHGGASLVESPSPQRTAWVVRAEADGHAYNVHVDRSTGSARVVTLD